MFSLILSPQTRRSFYHSVLLLSVLLLLVSASSKAQSQAARQLPATGLLKGTVQNANHIPLAAVSVYISGTSTGTITNAAGAYQLPLQPGLCTLSISLVGFQSRQIPVLVTTGTNRLDLILAESQYSLSELTVSARREEPAIRIMRNVIARRPYYATQIAAYRCQVYIRGLERLENAPDKFMGFNIHAELKNIGIDSGKRGILYFSESVSRLSVSKPARLHEEMISSKVSGNNTGFSFNQASDLMPDLYQSRVALKAVTEKLFGSPLADNGFTAYRYKLLGSTLTDGHKIYRIQLIPRRKDFPLFKGLLYIRDSSWNIQAMDLQLSESAKIELVDSLRIRGQYIELNHGVFVLGNMDYHYTWKLLKFRGNGSYQESFSNYELNPRFTPADFPSDMLHISTGANKRDTSYWNSTRSVPLTAEEIDDYARKDSVFLAHNTRKFKDSVDSRHNRLGPGFILLGKTFRYRADKASLAIAPVVTMLSYNTVEGLTLNPQGSFIKAITDTSSLSVSASLRYGFTDRRFNPSAGLGWTINSLKQEKISLAGGYAVTDQNSLGASDVLYNTVKTLLTKINPLKLYEKHFMQLTWTESFFRQLKLRGSLEYASRIPLPNTAFGYLSGPSDRHFTANDPFSPPGNGEAFVPNQALTLDMSARIDFGEKYSSRPGELMPQGSQYPSLKLDYRKGIKGFGGSASDYDFLSGRLIQTNIPDGGLGKFSYSLSGGGFITHRNLTYLDYQHFTSSSSALLQQGEAFQQLNAYKFSASRYYIHAHAEQNFMGALFSKIPVIRDLNLQEIAGAAWMRNDQLQSYTEIYLGIEYLKFRASYTFSFLDGHPYVNGITVNIGGF